MATGSTSYPNGSDFKNWNQAAAQAFYAAKYFEAVESTNTIRNAIAVGQAVTQVYFADKQYQIGKQAQDRLDNISSIELNRSGQLFGQFEKQIAKEDAQLAEAVNITVPEPDWNAIRLRVTASVTRQFTEAKRQVMQCYPVSCMEARCEAISKLETEKAKAIASEVEQAYQKERALWELRKNTNKAHLLDVLKFGRGAIGESNALLRGAQAAVEASSNINPNAGWTQAVNSIAKTAQGITTQGALAYRGIGANVSNAWNLGETANTVATEIAGPPAWAQNQDMPDLYAQQNMLNANGDGSVSGEPTQYNNSAIASQLLNPMG